MQDALAPALRSGQFNDIPRTHSSLVVSMLDFPSYSHALQSSPRSQTLPVLSLTLASHQYPSTHACCTSVLVQLPTSAVAGTDELVSLAAACCFSRAGTLKTTLQLLRRLRGLLSHSTSCRVERVRELIDGVDSGMHHVMQRTTETIFFRGASHAQRTGSRTYQDTSKIT